MPECGLSSAFLCCSAWLSISESASTWMMSSYRSSITMRSGELRVGAVGISVAAPQQIVGWCLPWHCAVRIRERSMGRWQTRVPARHRSCYGMATPGDRHQARLPCRFRSTYNRYRVAARRLRGTSSRILLCGMWIRFNLRWSAAAEVTVDREFEPTGKAITRSDRGFAGSSGPGSAVGDAGIDRLEQNRSHPRQVIVTEVVDARAEQNRRRRQPPLRPHPEESSPPRRHPCCRRRPCHLRSPTVSHYR